MGGHSEQERRLAEFMIGFENLPAETVVALDSLHDGDWGSSWLFVLRLLFFQNDYIYTFRLLILLCLRPYEIENLLKHESMFSTNSVQTK